MMTNSNYPCPITSCSHSKTSKSKPFSTITTLIQHLHSKNHKHSQHMVDLSICRDINLYCCSHHTCLSNPKRFFARKQELISHTSKYHSIPPINNTLQPQPPPNDLTTTIFNSLPNEHLLNHWTTGINFIQNNYDHPPPNFRTTWRHLVSGNNEKRFLTLQSKIIETIIQSTVESSSSFWWLLIHLELLIFAPTSRRKRNYTSMTSIPLN